MKKWISVVTLVSFLASTVGASPIYAQSKGDFVLPEAGIMVHLSPEFNPPILKGIKVHADNPFRFDFVLDQGDVKGTDLSNESTKLIKYFLASLTVPEKDLWVNLSPYEKDRIVPQSFGVTEMGRDLLAEDYMLKQITASLIYPEDAIGKKFWKRIYEEAQKKYGTTNIPVNTFNKVWIVPQKAVVYENAKAGTAYVVESKLKVMLEEDYVALNKNNQSAKSRGMAENSDDRGITIEKDTHTLGSQIVREIVIPELTKEVNEGKNFAQLRQVYNSLILATWYKKKIKDSILSQVYSDQNKIVGVSIDDPKEKERIYQQYLQAFKKGVYNYIKEDSDPITQQPVPRKYFSGGVNFLGNMAMVTTTDSAMIHEEKSDEVVRVNILPSSEKRAMYALNAERTKMIPLKYFTFDELSLSQREAVMEELKKWLGRDRFFLIRQLIQEYNSIKKGEKQLSDSVFPKIRFVLDAHDLVLGYMQMDTNYHQITIIQVGKAYEKRGVGTELFIAGLEEILEASGENKIRIAGIGPRLKEILLPFIGGKRDGENKIILEGEEGLGSVNITRQTAQEIIEKQRQRVNLRIAELGLESMAMTIVGKPLDVTRTHLMEKTRVELEKNRVTEPVLRALTAEELKDISGLGLKQTLSIMVNLINEGYARRSGPEILHYQVGHSTLRGQARMLEGEPVIDIHVQTVPRDDKNPSSLRQTIHEILEIFSWLTSQETLNKLAKMKYRKIVADTPNSFILAGLRKKGFEDAIIPWFDALLATTNYRYGVKYQGYPPYSLRGVRRVEFSLKTSQEDHAMLESNEGESVSVNANLRSTYVSLSDQEMQKIVLAYLHASDRRPLKNDWEDMRFLGQGANNFVIGYGHSALRVHKNLQGGLDNDIEFFELLHQLGVGPKVLGYSFIRINGIPHYVLEVERVANGSRELDSRELDNEEVNYIEKMLDKLIENRIFIRDFKLENFAIGPINREGKEVPKQAYIIDVDELVHYTKPFEPDQQQVASEYLELIRRSEKYTWAKWKDYDPEQRIVRYLEEKVKSYDSVLPKSEAMTTNISPEDIQKMRTWVAEDGLKKVVVINLLPFTIANTRSYRLQNKFIQDIKDAINQENVIELNFKETSPELLWGLVGQIADVIGPELYKMSWACPSWRVVIITLLKNALTHGNKLDLSLPVFIKFNKREKKIEVVDFANPVTGDLDLYKKMSLAGFGARLNIIRENYKMIVVPPMWINYGGQRLGIQVSVASPAMNTGVSNFEEIIKRSSFVDEEEMRQHLNELKSSPGPISALAGALNNAGNIYRGVRLKPEILKKILKDGLNPSTVFNKNHGTKNLFEALVYSFETYSPFSGAPKEDFLSVVFEYSEQKHGVIDNQTIPANDFEAIWLYDKSTKKLINIKDLAMAAQKESKADRAMDLEKGGIDFTANKTPLEIQNAGKSINFKLDPAMFAKLRNAPGFVPMIIDIEPMNNLKEFLLS